MLWSVGGWNQGPGTPVAGVYLLVHEAGPGASAGPLAGGAGPRVSGCMA